MFSALPMTQQRTAGDNKHLTIISELHIIYSKSFPCTNIVIGMIAHHGTKKKIIFFEERIFYHLNQQTKRRLIFSVFALTLQKAMNISKLFHSGIQQGIV